MIGFLGSLLGLLFTLPSTPGFDLTDEQRTRLAEGDVVVIELEPTGGAGVSVRSMALVDASPTVVWEVVRDCGRFDEFMPRLVYSRVTDAEGDRYVCEVKVDMPFPLRDLVSAGWSANERLPDGGFRRVWTLTPGEWDYERNDGSWSVHPWGKDADRTLLVSWIDMAPKIALPDWIVRVAQRQTAPDAFHAIRRRVSERAP